jgi:hypothetical protein
VHGESTADGTPGVYGSAGEGIGVRGSSATGTGVYATSTSSYGIYAVSTSGDAGYFGGDVEVVGDMTVIGNCCAAGAATSRIDHPLDPTNKYLSHSLVESPDMKTVYDGNATTDEKGEVTVQLPDWFEALNRDFRYQLTIVGDQFAQARVSSKIKDNRFTIKTDKPNIEVSWQVTGIRQDPYANAHRTPVEQGKPADEVGKYLHPEEYGQLTLSSPAPPTP